MASPGTLQLSVSSGGDLFIEQADFRTLITAELIGLLRAQAAEGRLHPAVSFGDGLLTIDAANRSVTYAIGERDGDYYPARRIYPQP